MRKIIFLSFSVYLFISCSVIAQVVTNGLVGYWPFDGNTLDQSSNSYHGLANAVFIADRNQVTNSALDFDDQHWMEISNSSSLSPTLSSEFTVSLWFNRKGINDADNVLVDFRDTQNDGFRISTELSQFVILDYNQYKLVVDDLAYGIGSWNHLLVTKRDQTVNVYLNGVLSSKQLNVALDSIVVGVNMFLSKRSFGGTSHLFDGSMDDIYIFDRVLSDEEICTLNDGTQCYEQSSSCANLFCDGENVGIGISDTRGYKLAVGGKIIGEEMTVSLVENWPDYVFEEGYPLRTLEETEAFIIRNKHLPEVPKESQIVENGLNVGEMNAKLLQKIEELTLYLIQQNKEIKMLKELTASQQAQLEVMKHSTYIAEKPNDQE